MWWFACRATWRITWQFTWQATWRVTWHRNCAWLSAWLSAWLPAWLSAWLPTWLPTCIRTQLPFALGPLLFLCLDGGSISIPLFKGGCLPFHYSKDDLFSFCFLMGSLPLLHSKADPFHCFIPKGPLFFFFILIRGPFHSFIQKEIPSISYSKKDPFHSFIQRRTTSLSLFDWGFPSVP